MNVRDKREKRETRETCDILNNITFENWKISPNKLYIYYVKGCLVFRRPYGP